MNRSEVLKFLRAHSLAVISTVDGNKPESAVVEFGELEDLTIVIDTFKTSRKYKNLQTNNNVAIVVGWDDNKTLQIEATAKELASDDLIAAKKAYVAKNPEAAKWQNSPDVAFIALTPNWMRYTDVGQHPWVIREIDL